jgi:hypothetical protein
VGTRGGAVEAEGVFVGGWHGGASGR